MLNISRGGPTFFNFTCNCGYQSKAPRQFDIFDCRYRSSIDQNVFCLKYHPPIVSSLFRHYIVSRPISQKYWNDKHNMMMSCRGLSRPVVELLIQLFTHSTQFTPEEDDKMDVETSSYKAPIDVTKQPIYETIHNKRIFTFTLMISQITKKKLYLCS